MLSDAPHDAPESPSNIDIVPLDQRLLAQFQSYLEENYAQPEASLTEAAKHCAMSKRALQRKLETLYQKSFSALLIDTRMAHACTLLRAGISATETAERCGYSTLSSFSRQFKDHFGQSPRDFTKPTTK
jgi:AraC-like DNA-binding protein